MTDYCLLFILFLCVTITCHYPQVQSCTRFCCILFKNSVPLNHPPLLPFFSCHPYYLSFPIISPAAVNYPHFRPFLSSQSFDPFFCFLSKSPDPPTPSHSLISSLWLTLAFIFSSLCSQSHQLLSLSESRYTVSSLVYPTPSHHPKKTTKQQPRSSKNVIFTLIVHFQQALY